MLCIIIQNPATYLLLILHAKSIGFDQSLKNIQIIFVQFMAFAIMKKHTWLVHAKGKNFSHCPILIHGLLQAVIYSSTVSALLVILKKDSSIFCINSWISYALNTGISLL